MVCAGGVELIVDIIKSFIKSVYDLNRTEAEKRKKEAYDRNYNCDCGSCSFCDFSIDHA